MDCEGPRGLQNLVKERTKSGVQQPFCLTIKKHSRAALVTWPIENEYQDYMEEVTDLNSIVHHLLICEILLANRDDLHITTFKVEREIEIWRCYLRKWDKVYY